MELRTHARDSAWQHGVDPDVTGDGGYTLLHHLSAQDSNDPSRVILATLLLDKGASLKKRDPLLKSTPLGWACRWGQSELVKLFLERGADPVETDAESWATPLSWAGRGKHQGITELLVNRPPN